MRQLSLTILILVPVFGCFSLMAADNSAHDKIREFVVDKKYQEAFLELQSAEKKAAFSVELNPEMYWLKAYLEYEIGMKNEAKADLTEIMKSDIWRSESAYYLALIEASNNNYKKVLELLAIAEKNNSNISLKSKIQFERARALVETKNWKEAVQQLKKIDRLLKGDPKYPEILKLMAKVNIELHNSRLACKTVERLYTKFPTDSIFKNGLPFIEKVDVLGTLLSCPVSDDLFLNHRRSLFAIGQVDLVNSEISSWIEKYKLVGYEKDVLAINKILNEGDFVKALDILLGYYEEKKNHIPYLALLGSVAGRAGNFSLSIGSNYRIFLLSGNVSQKRKVLYQAAILSFQIQDYDGAQDKFEKYIRNFSRAKNAIDAKWYIAWIQYLKGHFQDSSELMVNLLKDSRRQLKVTAYYEKIQYWLAMSLLKAGEINKSKMLFFQLVKNSRDNSFYSLVAKQRLAKINDLIKEPAISILKENNSNLRIFFKSFSVSAQSFPESNLNFNGAESSENNDATTGDDRAIASAGEEIATTDGENIEESVEVDKSEVVEIEVPDNFNSVKSAELQAKIEKARFLIYWGFEELGKSEYSDVEHYIIKNEKNKSVLEDYQKLKDFFRLSVLGFNVWSRRGAPNLDLANREIWEYMYPLAYREDIKKWSDEFKLPQALLWGIMKAESQYRPGVVSPVGAQGLMQIMPFTGKKVAELLGDNQFSAFSLKDPAVAIKIGSKYLERMSNNFQSSIPLIAAAYNAGPHRVQNWIYNFGYLEMDEWIEHIPYGETRLYVKKVASNYFAYLNLYGDTIKSKKISLIDPIPVQIHEPMPLIEKWD